MAKRTSILRRSKDVENRVQRYLWPGTSRPWKERWDLLSPDGKLCGEVKNEKPSSFGHAMTILLDALNQVESVAPDGALPFAVLVIPGTQVKNAIVAMNGVLTVDGYPVARAIMPISDFAKAIVRRD